MNRRWVLVALIFAGTVISYVDRGNLSIAAPSIMRDFGLPPARMGWLLSAFFVAYGVFQIPAGMTVDRLGSRRVFAAAFFVWSLASAAVALSRGPTDVFFLRLLLGMSEAAGPLASLSLIRRYFRGPESGLPISIYTGAQHVGPAVGALLGTTLLDAFGWRGMFAMTGLGAMFWLPLWLWLAPRDHDRRMREEPAPQAARVPTPWRRILRTPTFWSMSGCVLLFSYYSGFMLTWVPTYLTSTRGFTNIEMGRVLSAPYLAMAVAGIAAGSLADRLIGRSDAVFRVRMRFAIGGLLGASTVTLLPLFPQRAAVLPVLLFSFCSMAVAGSNYWAIAQHASPPGGVGRTIGYLNTLSQVAGASAPIITGWLIGPEKHFGVAILGCGACLTSAAALLAFTGPQRLERVKALMAGEPPDGAPHSA